MIGHMLKMYILTDHDKQWQEQEIEVMVTADRWEYDTGRNIEFMAVGMPDAFGFAVAEQRNTTPDTTIRTGDCRQGSWAGLATKVGLNQYQGVQSTAISNGASGLVSLNNGSRFEVDLAGSTANNLTRSLFGARIDSAFVNSYAKGAAVAGLGSERIKLPYYSNEILDSAPPYLYTASFGDALEPNTRTIRANPSKVRQEVFGRTGGTATTNFSSYGQDKVGGLTYLSAGTQVIGTTPSQTIVNMAAPFTGNGMGEVKRGSLGQATWWRWMLAGGTNTAPYAVHYLLLSIASDGTQTWQSSTNAPGTSGSVYFPEAYTMFTDDKVATADNADNRGVVLDAYYASKSKEASYNINYPMSVPIAFKRPLDKVGNKVSGTNKWTTTADFINHSYTIGGE